MAEYSGRDKRLQYLFEAVENVQVDDMTGASASTDGAHGLVPAPLAGDEDKYLKGDGTWAAVQAGAGALSGLSDVNLATPTDGQALVYDGANSKWKNGNVSGGGNTLVIQDASIYSTDEQQIGVWTDGVPIYQKTYQAQFSAGASTVQISLGIANIKHIISIEGILVPNGEPNRSIAIGGYSNSYNDDWLSFSANDTYQQNGYVTVRRRGDGYWGSDPYVYVTVRYTKTTDTAGSGGYKAYGLSPIIYSEEEREIGVWTDGKPLYQKTIDFGALSNATTKSVAHGIDNLDYIAFVSVVGKNSSNAFAPIPIVNTTALNQQVQIYFDTTNVNIRTATNYSAWSVCKVTIQYTKTTDTAGSGTWTTKGTYAHHYSTAEQVVGTWVDGSTLYERSWVLTSALSLTKGVWGDSNEIYFSALVDIRDAQMYRTDNHGVYNAYAVRCRVDNYKVGFLSPDTVSYPTGSVITLRYTKTS